MRIRIKPKRTRLKKRTIGITAKRKTKPLKRRADIMMPIAIQVKDSGIDLEDNVKLNCMSNIRNRAKATMKKKGYTDEDVKRILEMVRNEK